MIDLALAVLLAGPVDVPSTAAPAAAPAAAPSAAPSPAPLVTARIKQKGTIVSRARRDEEADLDQQLVKWDVEVENKSDLPAEVTRVRTIVVEKGARSAWDVPDFGIDEIARLAGTTRIAPHGTLEIPLRLYYEAPQRPLKISVEINGQLEHDAFFTLTTEAVDAQ